MLKSQKGYSIQKGPSQNFPIISFSLSNERPEVFLPKIEKELKKKCFRGLVLVDTLACNGLTSRRFFVGEFDGEQWKRSSFKVLPEENLDAATRLFCKKFYRSKLDSLSSAALSAVQIFKLKRDF